MLLIDANYKIFMFLELAQRITCILIATRDRLRAYPIPWVGGLQNSGTTAIADTFYNFVPNPTIHSINPRIYDVPWRENTPWHYRDNMTSPHHGWQENKELVLPVIVVRDPYRWMASMVRIPIKV
jgi:hypothetical protein